MDTKTMVPLGQLIAAKDLICALVSGIETLHGACEYNAQSANEANRRCKGLEDQHEAYAQAKFQAERVAEERRKDLAAERKRHKADVKELRHRIAELEGLALATAGVDVSEYYVDIRSAVSERIARDFAQGAGGSSGIPPTLFPAMQEEPALVVALIVRLLQFLNPEATRQVALELAPPSEPRPKRALAGQVERHKAGEP